MTKTVIHESHICFMVSGENIFGSIDPPKGCLIEEIAGTVYVYGPWGRDFGFWVLNSKSEELIEVIPTWQMFDRNGIPVARDASFYFTKEHLPTSKSAMPFYKWAHSIPMSVRRLAVDCADQYWTALDAMLDPSFRDFLTSEVEGKGVAYIRACWLLSDIDSCSRADRESLNRLFMTCKRKAVLEYFVSGDLPTCTENVLRRLDFRFVDGSDLKSLLQSLQSTEKAKVARHCNNLNYRTIELINRLPGWLLSPQIISTASKAPERRVPMELRTLIPKAVEYAAPRWHRLIKTSLAQSLSRTKDIDVFYDFMERWEKRLRPELSFPPIPFPGSDRLRPISSTKMLAEESQQMQNCVDEFLEELLWGETYFYSWRGAERATVELRRKNGRWVEHQALGHSNEELSANTLSSIRTEVQTGSDASDMFFQKSFLVGKGKGFSEDDKFDLFDGCPVLLEIDDGSNEPARPVKILTISNDYLGHIPEDEQFAIFKLLESKKKYYAYLYGAKGSSSENWMVIFYVQNPDAKFE